MTQSALITANRLREILRYDPETGRWTWRHRPAHDRHGRRWNTRYAGTEAGTLCKHHGYRFIWIDGKNYRAHRLAFLYMTGRWPCNEVDHKERVRGDCRWSAIREATHLQNQMNHGLQRNNTSGFKSVFENGDGWGSRMGKCWLGTYRTREDAAAAYLTAATLKFGEFARGR